MVVAVCLCCSLCLLVVCSLFVVVVSSFGSVVCIDVCFYLFGLCLWCCVSCFLFLFKCMNLVCC